MLQTSMIDALPYVLGRFPEGAALHYYSDVTVLISKITNAPLYNIFVFTRYGDIMDCRLNIEYLDVLRQIIDRWGYPLNGWRPLNGFSMFITERPGDLSRFYGSLWQ
jgi:hypothetical protein